MKTLTTFFIALCIAVCSYAQTPDCLPNCAKVVATKITKPFECLTTKKDSTLRLNLQGGSYYDVKIADLIPGGDDFASGIYNLNGSMVRFFHGNYQPLRLIPGLYGLYCGTLVIDHACKVLCTSCTILDQGLLRPPLVTPICDVKGAVMITQ
jgi:hypothetical protein